MTAEPDRHPVDAPDGVVRRHVRLGVLAVDHEACRVGFGFPRTALALTPAGGHAFQDGATRPSGSSTGWNAGD
ncbi:hypothetical protein AB0399_27090 [Streptomyces sp. NPDC088194]|uniref:hypothetical protein n=1 Tax=Streptomyces sp. NPDC088194 TaxID=3154931 RepID=UPI00344D73FD